MDRLKFFTLGESIIQSLSIGIVAFSRDMKIIEANRTASQILIESEKIDQALLKGTDPAVCPDWTLQLRTIIQKGATGRYNSIPYTKDNTTLLLDISCVPLKDNETSETIGGTLVLEDVTQRMKIEKRLASAEKLAAIGQVAGKVAHELNNPMDGILRYLSLSQRVIESGQPEKAPEYLMHCKEGITRMAKVVKDLLDFSRTTEPEDEYVSLEKVISDSVKAMSTHIESKEAKVEYSFDSEIGNIRGSSLFQVFCNLIKNATDAILTGGTISISTRKDINGNIIVSFKDTGHGISDEYIDSIFEPFFTTKEFGRGTGLGLSICKDIVGKYGGSIKAENHDDGGSVFDVILPYKEMSIG